MQMVASVVSVAMKAPSLFLEFDLIFKSLYYQQNRNRLSECLEVGDLPSSPYS